MSELWRRRVWAMEARTDAADRLALLALAELADAGGACRTGQRRLARMCGVGVRAVQATLGRVETAGFVAVDRVAGEANTYRLQGTRLGAGGAAGGDGGAVAGRGAVDDTGGDEAHDGGRGAAGAGAPAVSGDGGGLRPATPPACSAPATLKGMQHAAGDGQRGEPARLGESGAGAAPAAGKELSALLQARGVDAPVATRLAEAHPDRVRPLVDRFDRERAEKALGPGWLVSAIRGGWSAGAPQGEAGPGRLLTYAEMLHACERSGVTTDDFEAVPRPGQRPLWRRRD